MKRFDLIIVADLRFPGGTSTAIASELRALSGNGLDIALYQVDAPIFGKEKRPRHPEITAVIDDFAIPVLALGEPVKTDLLVVHNPLVMTQAPATEVRLEAGMRIMVAHAPPADSRGSLYYDPWQVDRICRNAFGGHFVWAPISPVCRDSFERAGVSLPCLADDWTNVIFVDDWGASRKGIRGPRPIIGRHSRPQSHKWPASRSEMLKAYPDRSDVEVHLLGAGRELEGLMGTYPANWKTWEFNEISVKDFLSAIDFFVYYHHPRWVEAFGRTVAEAASAGCVCILPPHFEPTFSEAALYAEIDEVMAKIERIAADSSTFAACSARGRLAIDRDYGPRRYLDRIATCLAVARGEKDLDTLLQVPAPANPLAKALRKGAYHAHALSKRRIRKLHRKLMRVVRRLAGS